MTEEIKKEFTLDEVAQHASAESCWLIIGNESNGGPKVYDVTKYLDDHPGGAEVMLDVGGQNADEFFEDIGHSKEARNELAKFLIGNFKLDAAAQAAMLAAAEAKAAQKGGFSVPVAMRFLVVILGALLGIFYSVYNHPAKSEPATA